MGNDVRKRVSRLASHAEFLGFLGEANRPGGCFLLYELKS
jgi:hypothetical protein